MSTGIIKETKSSEKPVEKEEKAGQLKQNVNCGICYSDLDHKNTVITPCNHAYCTTCFFKWLDRKETCALCRKVLLSNTVVEERLTDIRDVQRELMDNYRCLRVLKKTIKEKNREKRNLSDDVNSIIHRQIRMRCLLDQTRLVCKETLAHSKTLKEAVELQKESLDLMKNYRAEWEELHTPLPDYPAHKEEEEEAEEEEEINVVDMAVVLDNMLRIERRRARTALQRMHVEEQAAAETIEVENSDDDDAETETDSIHEEETNIFSSDDNDSNNDEDIEVDLTVFGTSIPTFDFTTPPRRTVRVPFPYRNYSQSPMFVFGQQSNSTSITNAFQIPTLFTPVSNEELLTSPSAIPPVLEMQRGRDHRFDWRREENSWPLNPGHTAMRRLFDSPSRTDNEEKTGE